jgi:hypothetical protein
LTSFPPLKWFWERFHFSEEMREREGLPEITKDVKGKILGLNYLRMHGLDAEACGSTRAHPESDKQVRPNSLNSSPGD